MYFYPSFTSRARGIGRSDAGAARECVARAETRQSATRVRLIVIRRVNRDATRVWGEKSREAIT